MLPVIYYLAVLLLPAEFRLEGVRLTESGHQARGKKERQPSKKLEKTLQKRKERLKGHWFYILVVHVLLLNTKKCFWGWMFSHRMSSEMVCWGEDPWYPNEVLHLCDDGMHGRSHHWSCHWATGFASQPLVVVFFCFPRERCPPKARSLKERNLV